jgi:hypothetical protein
VLQERRARHGRAVLQESAAGCIAAWDREQGAARGGR